MHNCGMMQDIIPFFEAEKPAMQKMTAIIR